MFKRNVFLKLITILFFTLGFCCSCDNKIAKLVDEEPPFQFQKWGANTTATLIGHAFGNVDGIAYTNSLEAFQENYARGIRTFEVDFQFTSDREIVLSHYWDGRLQKGISENNIPTKEKFLNTKILEKYTPLSFKELLYLINEYPDIWIITDSKYTDKATIQEEFSKMIEIAKEENLEKSLNRFIIQIYNEEMLESIKEIYSFETYIFTLYTRWGGSLEEYKKIVDWCYENDIKYITMWNFLFNEEIYNLANAKNIKIFVHTENDVDKANTFLEQGVRGIYTDSIEIENILDE